MFSAVLIPVPVGCGLVPPGWSSGGAWYQLERETVLGAGESEREGLRVEQGELLHPGMCSRPDPGRRPAKSTSSVVVADAGRAGSRVVVAGAP
ncbi:MULTISPECIES: hypothetical protein [Rhodococcus]|uniref:hypothetical protein n=1 Tax=Rhodococcus TaxID=1827 RepID=UPI000B1D5CBC|nr:MULTISPECIES: hypothetical protein [Rhodococcus]